MAPPPPCRRRDGSALIAAVIVTVLILCARVDLATAKICGSVHMQNVVTDLQMLDNCTVVTGHLELVLMTNYIDWEQYSFPDLVEIWDYLFIFNINSLVSLGKLFPNLRLVRGLHLIFDLNAIVLFIMPNLKEVGMKSLQKIERGRVVIGRCEKLHYYETIDWRKLGTELDLHYMPSERGSTCASECNGLCWSQNECQKVETINYCTKEEGCAETCPSKKVKLRLSFECITVDECRVIDDKHPWFVFNGTCINKCPRYYHQSLDTCQYCGENCVQICDGKDITTGTLLTTMEQCTHINGSLTLKIEDEAMAKVLPKYLGDIKEISGFLKITRSSAIKSLEFLKKLTLIKGEVLDDNNSLVIIENRNLKKLWTFDSNFKLKINAGTFRFHFNPQLDYRDIELLNNLTIKTNLTADMVSRESNGDQRRLLNLQINFSHIETTNVTLTWSGQNDVGLSEYYYYIYYIEDDEIDTTEDVCMVNGWNVVMTSDNFYTLVDLKPFSHYSLYIVQTMTSDKEQRKTETCQFKTVSGDPSGPRNVETFSYNATAIKLTWDPPAETRGELQKYVITYYKIQGEGSTLKLRDYCKHPVSSGYRGIPLKQEWNPKKKTITASEVDCECPATSNPKKRDVPADSDEIIFSSQLDFGQKMNQMSMKKKNRYTYISGSTEDSSSSQSDFIVNIPANQNSTIITGLDHFSTYMFYISACNKNRTLEPQCSEISMVYNRTSSLAGADDLNDYSLVESKTGVTLNWTNPSHPNSPILSYTVHWVGESTSNILCVLPSQLKSNGYKVHLLPGEYEVRVRAVTLAGAGNYTIFKSSFIAYPSNVSTTSWAIGLIMLMVVCVLLGGSIWIYYYRKQRRLDNVHLIQSVNPDYCDSTYVVDEWEIPREDVDIQTSLGKGTFGTVYSGYLKSRQLPCAVKTVNLSSTHEEKMQFLNEASVMKAFSNTHHVVRLLGVVSRAEIPLVIMELMACGDLKSFLRRNRDSSQTIGCNEMYRMAIEIADGMAYLSAKKFVHRDLAARNCMVAGDHTIKIGDFGMARDIYETDYYRKESQGLLPVRWMAPESLADGVFTTDSDIWSYGIVLWEMVTLAEQPYQGLGNADVWQFVITKGRMNRPPECPDLLYEIMDVCWRWHPSKRPQFIDIVNKLERHVSEDFKLMSFYHSREGQEYRLNVRDRPYNPPAMVPTSRGNKSPFAHYHRSDENIDLYSDESDPINYPSNPKQRSNLLSDYAEEEDNPGSNGYASLSKTPEGF